MTEDQEKKRLWSKMATGARWSALMRIVTRSVGTLTTLLVARLVAPSELGTFAVIVMPDAGLMAISELGLGLSLVQMQKDPVPYMHTAWTVQVIRGLALFAIEVLIAPFWCDFFHVPHAVWPMRVLALGQLILGLQSAAPALLKRSFEFNKMFVIYLAEAACHATATFALTAIFHNVWALLLGTLVGRSMRSIVTFLVCPMRMRFSFDKAKATEMFAFSKWLSLQYAADFVLQTFDNMVTGRVLGTVPLAQYRMAYQLATEAPLSVSWVVSAVAFPAFSRVQSDLERVRSKFRAMHGLVTALMMPMAALIVLFGHIMVPLLVGPRWTPAVAPLRILIFGAMLRAILQTAPPLLQGLGRSRADFKLKVVQTAALCVGLYPAAVYWGMTGVAMCVVFAAAAALPFWAVALRRVAKVTAEDMVKPIVVPILGTAASVLLVLVLPSPACTWGYLLGYGLLFLAVYAAISLGGYRLMPRSGFGSTLVEMRQ